MNAPQLLSINGFENDQTVLINGFTVAADIMEQECIAVYIEKNGDVWDKLFQGPNVVKEALKWINGIIK